MSFAHKGIQIECLANGHFRATLESKGEPVMVCKDTLSGVRDEVDKVLSRERSRRVRPSVPVYLFDGKELQLIEWRGFQTNTDLMLITNADGEKKRYKVSNWRSDGGLGGSFARGIGAYLIPVELVDDFLHDLDQRYRNARDEVEAAQKALAKAVDAVGVHLPSHYDLRNKSEEHELAIRGKLDELVRRSRIKPVDPVIPIRLETP